MVEIEIESGRLRGRRGGAALSFRGIPYAADTGGYHRFLAPRPEPNWTGVRDAVAHGDRCPQTVESIARIPVFSWYGQESAFSENCCTLNVFTPDLHPGARRPVMFYVHGGGYASGGSGGPALDGSNLAAFGDVVVVTVNHRLNLFGYSNLAGLNPELFCDAAVAGQLDLIAALQWVQRNITAFGGDPGNVTLFGQSGGGNKVMVLLTMPAARGLFRRAINMSGATGLNVVRPDQTLPYIDAFLKELSIGEGDCRKLQEVPFEALLQARNKAMVATRSDGAQPVIDGRHVLASPFSPEGLALHATVPLIIGTTDTEATLFLGNNVRNFEVDEAQLKARVQSQFGMDDSCAEALIDAYRQEDATRSAADILAYLTSDVLARGPLLHAVEVKASVGKAPVYLYNFDWKIAADGGVWRSPHTADIPFAFGTVDSAPTMTGAGTGPAEVARNMMSAFVAFARSGDPNNPLLPQWKPYDTASRATMVINEECKAIDDFRGVERTASAPLLGVVPAAMLRGPLFRGVD